MTAQAQSRSLSSERQSEKARSIFRDHALGWALLALFLASWAGQFYAGWMNFVAEAAEHNQSAQLFGREGYIWYFWDATLENWQSEFLQLLAFVVLTSFLIFKGSPESKDSDEEMKASIEQLTAEVQELRQSLLKR